MTRRESAILTAFTGILCGPFGEFHKYAEEIMGRPIMTHELGTKHISDELKDKSKPDFVKLAEGVK